MRSLDLKCPLCNEWYSFDRQSLSECSSCGHQIEPTDGREVVPRIEPELKTKRIRMALYVVGVPLLFFFPYGIVPGLLLVFIAGGMGHIVRYRCGYCGDYLNHDGSSFCPTCHSHVGFTVG